MNRLDRIAGTLGDYAGDSVLRDGDDIVARAVHVERDGVDYILAGCAFHSSLLAMQARDSPFSAMVATRVLVIERKAELEIGRVLTLPVGAIGRSLVARGPITFVLLSPDSAFAFTKVPGLLVVGVGEPIASWERATLDEVREQVPDLVTRFPG